MESKFAFNKLMFCEMERKNILLNPSRRLAFSSSDDQQNAEKANSQFLSRFLFAKKNSPAKTKGSVSKCLFGRPDEGETKELVKTMFQQERIRALNLYHFDIHNEQPVNLTPPASPYIGTNNSSLVAKKALLQNTPEMDSNCEGETRIISSCNTTTTPISTNNERKRRTPEKEDELEGNPSTDSVRVPFSKKIRQD